MYPLTRNQDGLEYNVATTQELGWARICSSPLIRNPDGLENSVATTQEQG